MSTNTWDDRFLDKLEEKGFTPEQVVNTIFSGNKENDRIRYLESELLALNTRVQQLEDNHSVSTGGMDEKLLLLDKENRLINRDIKRIAELKNKYLDLPEGADLGWTQTSREISYDGTMYKVEKMNDAGGISDLPEMQTGDIAYLVPDGRFHTPHDKTFIAILFKKDNYDQQNSIIRVIVNPHVTSRVRIFRRTYLRWFVGSLLIFYSDTGKGDFDNEIPEPSLIQITREEIDALEHDANMSLLLNAIGEANDTLQIDLRNSEGLTSALQGTISGILEIMSLNGLANVRRVDTNYPDQTVNVQITEWRPEITLDSIVRVYRLKKDFVWSGPVNGNLLDNTFKNGAYYPWNLAITLPGINLHHNVHDTDIAFYSAEVHLFMDGTINDPKDGGAPLTAKGNNYGEMVYEVMINGKIAKLAHYVELKNIELITSAALGQSTTSTELQGKAFKLSNGDSWRSIGIAVGEPSYADLHVTHTSYKVEQQWPHEIYMNGWVRGSSTTFAQMFGMFYKVTFKQTYVLILAAEDGVNGGGYGTVRMQMADGTTAHESVHPGTIILEGKPYTGAIVSFVEETVDIMSVFDERRSYMRDVGDAYQMYYEGNLVTDSHRGVYLAGLLNWDPISHVPLSNTVNIKFNAPRNDRAVYFTNLKDSSVVDAVIGLDCTTYYDKGQKRTLRIELEGVHTYDVMRTYGRYVIHRTNWDSRAIRDIRNGISALRLEIDSLEDRVDMAEQTLNRIVETLTPEKSEQMEKFLIGAIGFGLTIVTGNPIFQLVGQVAIDAIDTAYEVKRHAERASELWENFGLEVFNDMAGILAMFRSFRDMYKSIKPKVEKLLGSSKTLANEVIRQHPQFAKLTNLLPSANNITRNNIINRFKRIGYKFKGDDPHVYHKYGFIKNKIKDNDKVYQTKGTFVKMENALVSQGVGTALKAPIIKMNNFTNREIPDFCMKAEMPQNNGILVYQSSNALDVINKLERDLRVQETQLGEMKQFLSTPLSGNDKRTSTELANDLYQEIFV